MESVQTYLQPAYRQGKIVIPYGHALVQRTVGHAVQLPHQGDAIAVQAVAALWEGGTLPDGVEVTQKGDAVSFSIPIGDTKVSESSGVSRSSRRGTIRPSFLMETARPATINRSEAFSSTACFRYVWTLSIVLFAPFVNFNPDRQLWDS